MSTQPNQPRQTVKVEYAPGRVVEMELVAGPPKLCLCRLQPQANGTFVPIPITLSPHVRVTERLPQELGLPMSYFVLRKLIKAGFVRGCMPSPGTTMVDLESLHEHLTATALTPGTAPFWTPQRVEAFTSAFGALRDTEG